MSENALERPRSIARQRVGSERRLAARALSRWDAARGDRTFPTHAEFLNDDGADFASNMMLIEASETGDRYQIVDAGGELANAFGPDVVGREIDDVLPSSIERGLSFCSTAAIMKKPIADVGQFVNNSGEELHYRGILMPLSDNQETVNILLGAFSYKISA